MTLSDNLIFKYPIEYYVGFFFEKKMMKVLTFSSFYKVSYIFSWTGTILC